MRVLSPTTRRTTQHRIVFRVDSGGIWHTILETPRKLFAVFLERESLHCVDGARIATDAQGNVRRGRSTKLPHLELPTAEARKTERHLLLTVRQQRLNQDKVKLTHEDLTTMVGSLHRVGYEAQVAAETTGPGRMTMKKPHLLQVWGGAFHRSDDDLATTDDFDHRCLRWMTCPQVGSRGEDDGQVALDTLAVDCVGEGGDRHKAAETEATEMAIDSMQLHNVVTCLPRYEVEGFDCTMRERLGKEWLRVGKRSAFCGTRV